ncbi:MAG: hypothetical protein CL431_01130 [Acidimicrobiaceae bacterium]|jgi:hypothetical protein|nr:hypothetical protein [Acidimicrobiaceae bacterium]|tara:strand:+ start:583 stop:1062 length:480 start_codon:yes stop_codon:yes gene_type:complete
MWVYIVIASVLVLVPAWLTVVLVSARLRNTPEQIVFDIDKATDYVADNLPDEVTRKISYIDVETLIKLELTYLRQRGIASYGSVDFLAEKASKTIDTVLAHEDELVDQLLRQAHEKNLDIDALDIVCVTNLVNEYLGKLGVVGEEVSEFSFGEIEGSES